MNDSDILYSQCFLFSCSCFHNWSGSSFSSHCWVKEFETPKASQQYSACCRDFKEYISTCPKYADNWEINRKCRDEPASLVYEGVPLSGLLIETNTYRHGTTKCTLSFTYNLEIWGWFFQYRNPTFLEISLKTATVQLVVVLHGWDVVYWTSQLLNGR